MSAPVVSTATMPTIPEESYLQKPQIITLTHVNERGETVTHRYRLHLFARDKSGKPIANEATQKTATKATELFQQYAQELSRLRPSTFAGKSIIQIGKPEADLARETLTEPTRDTLHSLLESGEKTEESMKRVPATMGRLWTTIFPKSIPHTDEPTPQLDDSAHHLVRARLQERDSRPTPRPALPELPALPPAPSTPPASPGSHSPSPTGSRGAESPFSLVSTPSPVELPQPPINPRAEAVEILTRDNEVHIARINPSHPTHGTQMRVSVRGDGDCLIRAIMVDLLLNKKYEKIESFLQSYQRGGTPGSLDASPVRPGETTSDHPARTLTSDDADRLQELLSQIKSGTLTLQEVLSDETHELDELFSDISRDAIARQITEVGTFEYGDEIAAEKAAEARVRKGKLGDAHEGALIALFGLQMCRHSNATTEPQFSGEGDHLVTVLHETDGGGHYDLLLS